MTGHDCSECRATIAQCDEHIKEHGQGCCGACFIRDTHGLLDKFKVIDVAEQQQDIENLHRLVAQMVIARSEHAKTIRGLMADMEAVVEQINLLRGKQERADEAEKRHLLTEVMTEVRAVVRELPERLAIVEKALPEIERRVGLRRKEAAFKPPPRTS